MRKTSKVSVAANKWYGRAYLHLGIVNRNLSIRKLGKSRTLLFIEEHKLHLFGIIETDLHGENSRISRQSSLSLEDIKDTLKVEGYRIVVPAT